MYTLKHDHLKATVNPVGAELSSLLCNGTELMWQGDEQFWTGRAPILFPIVGALKDGTMTFRGKHYELPRHGIARHATFETFEQSDSSVSMRLTADEKTLQVYPWDFELQVHFSLRRSGLEICYDIYNRDSSDMLYTIGSHPAFALEINNQYSFSDYEIAFDQPESLATYSLNEDGLLDTEPHSFACAGTGNATIRLSEEIFNDDALVFRDINSRQVSLHRDGKVLLTVDTGGAPHLGIWAKPGAPFVCIEPWFGTSDFIDSNGDFETKPDLHKLAPQQKSSHTVAVTAKAE